MGVRYANHYTKLHTNEAFKSLISRVILANEFNAYTIEGSREKKYAKSKMSNFLIIMPFGS